MLLPPFTGRVKGVPAKGDQKWETIPIRKPSGKSAYPPMLNWWVRSREPGPDSELGLRLSRALFTKSWSPPAAQVGLQVLEPELTKRDKL